MGLLAPYVINIEWISAVKLYKFSERTLVIETLGTMDKPQFVTRVCSRLFSYPGSWRAAIYVLIGKQKRNLRNGLKVFV